jgi:citrate lyase subunit beta/citryl-CoA lyase
MLFVPVHIEKFVAHAHERGADACILDLEDSVPLAQKAEARNMLRAVSGRLARQGTAVLVRVNQPSELAQLDIEAAVDPTVDAIVLPKVGSRERVCEMESRLGELEARRGLPVGRIRLIAQIEDVHALSQLDEIAASSPRLLGMILGSEDFSASAGMAPIPEALMLPNQLVLLACRRAGILPFGFPGSIANISDMRSFREQVRLARKLGFVGAFCVHPAQVDVLNEEFSPSPEELAFASGVLEAFEAAARDGRAAAEYRAKLIDPPVVAQAQEVIRHHQSRISTSQETI